MPTGLQKSVISFPLVKGVDSGESPVLVPPDQALGLQNMRFNRGVVGSLTKRYGYDAIASAPAGGTNLFTFQSNSGVEELDLIADGTLYAFAPATNAYQSRPGLTPAFTAAELPLAGSSINQANPDGCQAATATGVIGVYAWEQAGGLYYTVIDEAAGTVIQPVTLLSSSGGHPCVRNVNGSPVIFYSDSAGAVNAATFSVLTPASAPSVAAVSTGNRPSTPITAVVLGGFVFLACYGTIELQLLKLTPFAWSSTSTTLGVLGAGLVLCEGDASHLVLVTWAGNTNTVRVDGYSTALFHGGTNTATMPAGNIAQIATSVFLPGNTNFAVRVLVQTQVDGDVNTTSIYKFTTSNLAAITFSGVQQLARSVGLASGPWQGNGDTYVLACFPDPTQGTDYILDGNTGVVVGKLLVGKGSALSTNEQLPQASQQGSAVTLALTSAILVQRTVTAQNTTTSTDTYGIVRFTTSTTPGTYSTAQAGLSALIATGTLLQQYDGSNVVEQGYNLIPATPTGSLASPPVRIVVTQPQDDATKAQAPNPALPFVALIAFPKNLNDGQALGNQLLELGIQPGDYFTLEGTWTEPQARVSTFGTQSTAWAPTLHPVAPLRPDTISPFPRRLRPTSSPSRPRPPCRAMLAPTQFSARLTPGALPSVWFCTSPLPQATFTQTRPSQSSLRSLRSSPRLRAWALLTSLRLTARLRPFFVGARPLGSRPRTRPASPTPITPGRQWTASAPIPNSGAITTE